MQVIPDPSDAFSNNRETARMIFFFNFKFMDYGDFFPLVYGDKGCEKMKGFSINPNGLLPFIDSSSS